MYMMRLYRNASVLVFDGRDVLLKFALLVECLIYRSDQFPGGREYTPSVRRFIQ